MATKQQQTREVVGNDTRAQLNKSNYMINDNYIIDEEIGAGSFGKVYTALDKANHTKVACKVEDKGERSRLAIEYSHYQSIRKRGVTMIPAIYTLLNTPRFNILVMELMKVSLSDIIEKHIGNIPISFIVKTSIDIMEIMKQVHTAGFIHRDIKPDNFMFNKRDQLCIIDLGLAKRYIDKNGTHMPFRQDRELIGTARYASINMHQGFEPSRRDDMEAVGYMIMYMLRGSLPWQGLKKDKKTAHYNKIGDVKIYTSLDKLCNNYHGNFMKYIEYCRKLEFTAAPDYDYMISLFRGVATDNKITPSYTI